MRLGELLGSGIALFAHDKKARKPRIGDWVLLAPVKLDGHIPHGSHEVAIDSFAHSNCTHRIKRGPTNEIAFTSNMNIQKAVGGLNDSACSESVEVLLQ